MKFITISVLACAVFLGAPVVFATTPHTINIDANLSDWDDDELVWNDPSSDCLWDFNELYEMYVTWDDQNLYLGAGFEIEEANSLSFYMDFGFGEGAHDLGTVSWYKYFYTQDWLCNYSVNISGDATAGVFRIYGDNFHEELTNNPNLNYAIDLVNGVYEFSIPWNVLYSGSFMTGAYGKIVCTLTGFRGYDGADAMPQQTNEPNGDGNYDYLDKLYMLNFDSDNDGVPESGWHPNTNSGASGSPPNAKAEADPVSGTVPLSVAFTGIGNDPDGGDVTYHWDFGDGNTSEDQMPTHVYNTEGSYNAILTVTDDESQTATDSVAITVLPSGQEDPFVQIDLSKESPNCYRGGDYFDLKVNITNPGSAISADLYVLLSVADAYFYFWPSWGEALDFEPVNLPENDSHSVDILQFEWPPNAGSGSGLLFYAAMFQTGSYELIGNLDDASVCYE